MSEASASGAAGEAAAADAEGLAAETALLAYLDEIGVAGEIFRHPPVFTVEEAQVHTAHLPGAHVKNMFLKDKDARLWLVTCLDERRIKIRDLEKTLGARKMSFGKPELLWEALGVRPGAVTPLALTIDRAAKRVRFALDQAILAADVVNCHPMHNAATIALTPAALEAVWTATGHPPVLVDFDALERAAAAG